MKNKDKPAFPVKGGMVFHIPEEHQKEVREIADQQEGFAKKYEGMTAKEYAMIHAPEIPEWFHPDTTGNNFKDWRNDHAEQRYFQWRKYFAEKILEL